MATSTSTSIPAPTKTIAIHGLPSCVGPCTSLIATLTDCYDKPAPTGYQCACKSAAFVSEAANCIASYCPGDQFHSFASQAGRICSGIGAPLPATVVITANSTSFELTSLGATLSSTKNASAAPSPTPTPASGSGATTGAPPTTTKASNSRSTYPISGILKLAMMTVLVQALVLN